ncbi:MAG: hypothetical protein ACE365_00855 [Gammaproteobacteria bacterium]
MFKKFQSTVKRLVLCMSVVIATNAFAQQYGTVTGNVLNMAKTLSGFINTVFFILGAGFLMMAFVQYNQHRKNPIQVPISRVIVLVLLGLVFLLITLIAKYAPGSGILGSG